MTEGIGTTTEAPVRWQRTPVTALGLVGAVLLAAAGIAFSRPDLVAIGLPLGMATAWALARRPAAGILRLTVSARASSDAPKDGVVAGEVDAVVAADWVQLAVDQGGAQGLQDLAAHGVPPHLGAGGLVRVLPVGVLAAGLLGHPDGRGGHGRASAVRGTHLLARTALLHGYLLGRSRARSRVGRPECTIGARAPSSHIDPAG